MSADLVRVNPTSIHLPLSKSLRSCTEEGRKVRPVEIPELRADWLGISRDNGLPVLRFPVVVIQVNFPAWQYSLLSARVMRFVPPLLGQLSGDG